MQEYLEALNLGRLASDVHTLCAQRAGAEPHRGCMVEGQTIRAETLATMLYLSACQAVI